MAGIMGTNTSPSALIALWNGFPFFAAACFTSSFDAAVIPATAINSSYTLFTVPVPKMI